MTSPDDLTSLFTDPTDGTDLPFRQGVILSFNSATGNNTINVGGAVLTDVPLLNIGDTVNLSPGDIVVLMKLKSSWAILGRVVTPGSSVLNSTAIYTSGSNPFAQTFALTTSLVVRASGVVQVPAWANTASIFAYCWANALNSTANPDNIVCQTSVNISGVGTFGGAQLFSATVPAGQIGMAFAGGSRTAQTVTPGGTVTVQGAIQSLNAGWASSANNIIQVESVITFYKT